ncbi:Uncharacterised protein [Vibrio cholerae]|uniref:Uncharacterized protein n=1 Tax=Vibrio cholerae TaxID=666 RepID=A0A655VUT4_VIBCL|nr:Uncharacterised protein [Vibrio cholerae]CSB51333.1 Uncharacterised protein [Vibrio cholerae]CSB75821.1 Uncharacterised protein [Vibrio cholerae]CSB88863.1 Uncharacterised protein [Vibrio cholerae]CSC02680.1 Uncharacterised protein [Vibrio cholerae]
MRSSNKCCLFQLVLITSGVIVSIAVTLSGWVIAALSPAPERAQAEAHKIKAPPIPSLPPTIKALPFWPL